MNFGIGDKVSFLNEKGGGIVTKVINKKMVEVTIDDGFVFPYAVSELVMIEAATREPEPIPEKEEEKVDVSKLFKQKINHSDKPKKSKPHSYGMQEMEINLHIEELLDNYSGMSNAEIINVQLRHFQKALDKAIAGRFRKLIVIHGVGNGRLKHEVRRILDNEEMRYYDGSYAKYGYGATEVFIG